MEEETWRSNPGGGIMEEESWRRKHGGVIMEEPGAATRSSHQEQPGAARSTQETPRRHPRSHPEAPMAPGKFVR